MSKYHGLGAALCCVFTAQGKDKPQIPNVNLDIASIAEIPSCDMAHSDVDDAGYQALDQMVAQIN